MKNRIEHENKKPELFNFERGGRFVRMSEAARITGISVGCLYALQKRGQFPPRVKLGARTVAIRAEELRAWIETREIA